MPPDSGFHRLHESFGRDAELSGCHAQKDAELSGCWVVERTSFGVVRPLRRVPALQTQTSPCNRFPRSLGAQPAVLQRQLAFGQFQEPLDKAPGAMSAGSEADSECPPKKTTYFNLMEHLTGE